MTELPSTYFLLLQIFSYIKFDIVSKITVQCIINAMYIFFCFTSFISTITGHVHSIDDTRPDETGQYKTHNTSTIYMKHVKEGHVIL